MKVNIIGAIDPQGRCRHYHSERDIVAIRMKCCGAHYACYYCHVEEADHPAAVWPKAEWRTAKAILCGQCRTELTIAEYMNAEAGCPACGHPFNPGCRNHYPYYFEMEKSSN